MVAVQGAEPGTQARLGGQAVLRYTDHPLPSCHTSPRQGRATIWGCVTLIQARSCKSLTFSMSLFLFFFWGKEMLQSLGSRPQSIWPLRPTSASWILPYTPPAQPCPRVGGSQGLLCFAAQRTFPASSHTPPTLAARTLGPLPVSPPRALPVLFLYCGSGSS